MGIRYICKKQKTMEKLKVGDKLCRISYARFGNNIYYDFSEVERLTKTRAVLSNGIQLINEISKDFSGNIVFRVYGERYDYWQPVTEKILLDSEKEKKRQTIDSWFRSQQFTDEEKEIIFNTLNKKQ